MSFVSYGKMSKKQQKELNNSKRSSWGFSPVTRVKPSKKVYDRKKVNRERVY